MARIIYEKAPESGIALGGLGTGSVELFPDGEFHQWQIANQPRWSTVCNESAADDGESSTGALSFWIRTEEADGTVRIRKLGMKTDAEDFRYKMFTWNKPVEKIVFEGRFPVCDIEYRDSMLPLNISMRATAPFVPHDSKNSSVPGFYIDFSISNPSEKTVSVSLLSAIEPNFCNDGGCENELFKDGNITGIFMKSPHYPSWQNRDLESNRGSLCYSASGGDISFITAEACRFFHNYVSYSKFGVSEESFMFGFRERGCLPDSIPGTPPIDIPEQVNDLKDEAVDRYISELLKYPSVQSIYNRIIRIKQNISSREDKEAFLHACRNLRDQQGDKFGTCALCSRIILAPGEKKRVSFVFTWYFPNHFGKYGKHLGHMYENMFGNALEANRHLYSNRKEIADKAQAFAALLYNTDLPEVYPDSWSGQLSTLVKCSWYLKDGRFALWEGLGFCGFHTTDITYQASFGLLALFPDLQKKQIEMGAHFQREDGRVHHFFTPDLDHVDNGFDRIDMNNQFVLMVYRDYLYTGDRSYLERLWGNIKKAMDSIGELDKDGDGLPDTGTTRNTYDAWNFSGTPVYICILWLAALKAASAVADLLGDVDRAFQWRSVLEKGLDSLERRLWNGRYYDLWRRDENGTAFVDGSLMTDQIDGEWFLRVSGIGGILPDEKVCEVLKSVYDGNFTREGGLINATCPEGKSVSLDTYRNCQAEAIWTGIGYTIAALALTVGKTEIADAIVSNTHESQLRLGALWSHQECGYRYTRPLSSWTTMTAASGIEIDSAKKTMSLSPCKNEIKVPVCTCDFIGTAVFHNGNCEITLSEGNLESWKVTLRGGGIITVINS